MDELLTMSYREISRLEVMQRLKDKSLRQQEKPLHMLDVSIRHVRRLFRAYKARGPSGLVSRHRGKPSNNQLDPETVQEAIELNFLRTLHVTSRSNLSP